jgi:hypothetical protein
LFFFFFFLKEKEVRAVGMWESRVLGEISKSLWEPFCGFHRDVISTALFMPSLAAVHGATGGVP